MHYRIYLFTLQASWCCKTPDPQQPEDAQPKQASDSESLQATLTTIAQETTFQPLQFKFSAHDGFPTLPEGRFSRSGPNLWTFFHVWNTRPYDWTYQRLRWIKRRQLRRCGLEAARPYLERHFKAWTKAMDRYSHLWSSGSTFFVEGLELQFFDLRATDNNISSSLGSPTISRSIGKWEYIKEVTSLSPQQPRTGCMHYRNTEKRGAYFSRQQRPKP